MRAIDADALLQGWYNILPRTAIDREGAVPTDFRLVIREVNTATTLTLDDLRPKGRWNIVEIDKASNRITIECPECGMVEEMSLTAYGLGRNFCPNCGADMRGGGEDA